MAEHYIKRPILFWKRKGKWAPADYSRFSREDEMRRDLIFPFLEHLLGFRGDETLLWKGEEVHLGYDNRADVVGLVRTGDDKFKWVVLELKKRKATDEVVGQLLRYMAILYYASESELRSILLEQGDPIGEVEDWENTVEEIVSSSSEDIDIEGYVVFPVEEGGSKDYLVVQKIVDYLALHEVKIYLLELKLFKFQEFEVVEVDTWSAPQERRGTQNEDWGKRSSRYYAKKLREVGDFETYADKQYIHVLLKDNETLRRLRKEGIYVEFLLSGQKGDEYVQPRVRVKFPGESEGLAKSFYESAPDKLQKEDKGKNVYIYLRNPRSGPIPIPPVEEGVSVEMGVEKMVEDARELLNLLLNWAEKNGR